MSEFLSIAPFCGLQDQDILTECRNKAVATTLTVLAQNYPEIGTAFAGGNPTSNEQYAVWQDYGTIYGYAGRQKVLENLWANGEVLDGDQADVLQHMGNIALNFANTERQLRRDTYCHVLLPSIVACIELSDQQQSYLHASVGNNLGLIAHEHQRVPSVIGNMVGSVLNTHILRRMPTEKTLLFDALNQHQTVAA